MQTLFFVCFGVGIGYILISFILGEAFGLLDFDTQFEFDGFLSPLKPSVIAAFLAIFGGIGLLLMSRMSVLPTVTIAGISGLGVSYFFYRVIIVNLYKAQNTSAVEIQSLVGHSATVTEYIPQGKYGKITYYVNGNTYSAPAKSEDGDEIKRNETVEIIHIEKSTYYVRRK